MMLLFKKYIILFLFCYSIPFILFAQKDDIIRLANGDKLIAEIKLMDVAQLKLSTDAMSTVYADWHKVVYIKSNKSFRVEEENGLFWLGSIDTDSLTGNLIIVASNENYYLKFSDVVKIIPIENTFWERLKLNADLGFNFTKASEIATLSFSGKANYRTLQYERELSISSVTTAKKDNSNAQTHDVNFTFGRFWQNHTFLNGFTGFQKNSELGLDLRFLAGSSFGKDFLRSNSLLFNGALGAQYTRETMNGDTPKGSLEGVLNFNFNKFQYHSPKINWATSFSVYPSITNWGRIRYDFSSNLSWEIYSDLYWKFTIYDYFDNQPATSSGKHDYGVVISFGWSKS